MVWSMAFMETRRTGGGARRYRVWWRLGGSRYGEPQSETFDTLADARTFKAAVEVAGHQWPENYLPRQGWIRAHTTEPVEPVPFGDYALTYVRACRVWRRAPATITNATSRDICYLPLGSSISAIALRSHPRWYVSG